MIRLSVLCATLSIYTIRSILIRKDNNPMIKVIVEWYLCAVLVTHESGKTMLVQNDPDQWLVDNAIDGDNLPDEVEILDDYFPYFK